MRVRDLFRRGPPVESRIERVALLAVCWVIGVAYLLRIGWQLGRVLAGVLHGVG